MLSENRITYWTSLLTLMGTLIGGGIWLMNQIATKDDLDKVSKQMRVYYLEGKLNHHEKIVIDYEDMKAAGIDITDSRLRAYNQSLKAIDRLNAELEQLK